MKPQPFVAQLHNKAVTNKKGRQLPSSTQDPWPWGKNGSFMPIAVATLGLCLLLAAWAMTLNQLDSTRNSLLHGVSVGQHNLISVIDKNLHQALDEHQVLSDMVRIGVDNDDHLPFIHIPQLLSGQHFFNRMQVMTTRGIHIYQSSPGTDYTQFAPLIAALVAEHPQTRNPFIFSTQLLRDDTPWQIPLLFPVATKRQKTVIMVLEADLGYLLNLYQDVELGQSGAIHILTNHGEPLVHIKQGALVLQTGKKRDNRRLAESAEGVTQTHKNREYLTSHRFLSTYPLIVCVEQSLSEILQSYHHWRQQQFLVLSVISLISLIGFGWLVWVAHQNHRYLQALIVADQKNAELIQQLEREHQQAVNAAARDPLTDLYNRRLFIELGQKQLLYGKRKKLRYAVLFIDLDHFKEINDTYGHAVGDTLLKEVAQRLRKSLREADIIARYGGDEFVVLLNSITTDEDIYQVTEKLVASLSQPYGNSSSPPPSDVSEYRSRTVSATCRRYSNPSASSRCCHVLVKEKRSSEMHFLSPEAFELSHATP